MDIVTAGVLGVIQGLTEFLPVSSSGHLELGKALLSDTSIPEESLSFTVVLHFATALSTIVVFRKDIMLLIQEILTFKWNTSMQFAVKIILSMIPAVIIGLCFEEQLEQFFSGSLVFVGSMLILTALLLALASRAKKTQKPVTFKDSCIIGLAQAVAMLPGISRSGSTIATSVLLGNDKTNAARFSFLMVLPLIFGKIAKDLISGDLDFTPADSTGLVVGFITAFLTGVLACRLMIRWVKNSKLIYFSYYCFVVGFLAIALSSS